MTERFTTEFGCEIVTVHGKWKSLNDRAEPWKFAGGSIQKRVEELRCLNPQSTYVVRPMGEGYVIVQTDPSELPRVFDKSVGVSVLASDLFRELFRQAKARGHICRHMPQLCLIGGWADELGRLRRTRIHAGQFARIGWQHFSPVETTLPPTRADVAAGLLRAITLLIKFQRPETWIQSSSLNEHTVFYEGYGATITFREILSDWHWSSLDPALNQYCRDSDAWWKEASHPVSTLGSKP